MEFEESGRLFQFGEGWVVRRYDAHRYYQAISGSHMKGVDFVGIYQNRFLLFIEVKDYTLRYGDTLPAEVPPLDDPARFARTIERKLQDSLRAVRVFRLALLRNWRYRFFHHLAQPFLPARHDWRFWTRAHQLLHVDGAVHAMLWLELAPAYPARYLPALLEKRRRELVEALDHHLPSGISSLCINSSAQPPPAQLLRVTRQPD